MKEERFDVTGMTCSACSARVEKAASKLQGMESVTVNLLTNSMKVQYNEEDLDTNTIIKAVEHAGYGASPAEKGTAGQQEDREESRNRHNLAGQELKQMRGRLILSIVFLVPLMYLSMGHMMQMELGVPAPAFMERLFFGTENAIAMVFGQFLLLLPILYANRKYFSVGFKSLLHGGPNMDTLIAIGSAAAVVYGCFALFRIGYGMGHGDAELVHRYSMDIYFE